MPTEILFAQLVSTWGEEVPVTWGKCGCASFHLGAPQLGSDQQQRDLAWDSEEPLELDLVLVLHWRGVQSRPVLGGMLSHQSECCRGPELCGGCYSSVLWEGREAQEKDNPIQAPTNNATVCDVPSAWDPAVGMVFHHRLWQNHFWIGVLRHTLWVSKLQRLIISSQPAGYLGPCFKSLLHMVAFTGLLTVKKKGYYSTQ